MSKLVIAVIHDEDAGNVISALHDADFRVTRLASRGGFLRSRNTTLMVGLEDAQLAGAIEIIERNCEPRTEQVPIEVLGGLEASWLPTEVIHGGATIFVLPLDEIRRL